MWMGNGRQRCVAHGRKVFIAVYRINWNSHKIAHECCACDQCIMSNAHALTGANTQCHASQAR